MNPHSEIKQGVQTYIYIYIYKGVVTVPVSSINIIKRGMQHANHMLQSHIQRIQKSANQSYNELGRVGKSARHVKQSSQSSTKDLQQHFQQQETDSFFYFSQKLSIKYDIILRRLPNSLNLENMPLNQTINFLMSLNSIGEKRSYRCHRPNSINSCIYIQ